MVAYAAANNDETPSPATATATVTSTDGNETNDTDEEEMDDVKKKGPFTQRENSQVSERWCAVSQVHFEEFMVANVTSIKNFLRSGYLSYQAVPHAKGHIDYVAAREFNWVAWLKMMKSCGIAKWEKDVVMIKEELYEKYASCFLADQEQHMLQLTAVLDHCINEYLNVYKYSKTWVNDYAK